MNKDLLDAEMKNRGISREQMCKYLGISRSAFYRKCTGKSEFTLKEISQIMRVLGLRTPEGIFFEVEVS